MSLSSRWIVLGLRHGSGITEGVLDSEDPILALGSEGNALKRYNHNRLLDVRTCEVRNSCTKQSTYH